MAELGRAAGHTAARKGRDLGAPAAAAPGDSVAEAQMAARRFRWARFSDKGCGDHIGVLHKRKGLPTRVYLM